MSENNLQPIVAIKHHNIALLFDNYLQTINLQSEIIKEAEGYVIYCPSEMVEQIKREFGQFIQDPYNEKYQQAAWQHGQTGDFDNNYPTLLSSFRQQFFSHAGIITLSVFALCWAVFLASNAGWGNAIFAQLKYYNELSVNNFMESPLRIIGPAFFHFSWLHIVFNTMWWWQLGGNIEKVMGKWVIINILLISAIASNLGQFVVTGPNFGGLSGVVYALVGYVWWMGWLLPEKGLTITKPVVGFLLVWMMLGFAQLLPINMANMAHLLGLVSGCLIAGVTAFQAKNQSNPNS